MRTEWIESHLSLRNHPKIAKLENVLNINTFEAIGLIHSFWWWVVEYAPDGNLVGYDDWLIAKGVGYDIEKAEELLDALYYVGFIDEDEDGNLCVHDWMDYSAGKLKGQENKVEKKREKARDRQRKHREKLKLEKKIIELPNNVTLLSQDVSHSCHTAMSHPVTPCHAPTIQDNTVHNNNTLAHEDVRSDVPFADESFTDESADECAEQLQDDYSFTSDTDIATSSGEMPLRENELAACDELTADGESVDSTHSDTHLETVSDAKIVDGHDTQSTKSKKSIQEQRFDEFWDIYPKKKSKEQARKAWKKVNPSGEKHAKIISQVKYNIEFNPQWHKDNGQYIPYPATWLNAGGWEDEIFTGLEGSVNSATGNSGYDFSAFEV